MMTTGTLFTLWGLGLDVIGVTLLFFRSPPPPDFSSPGYSRPDEAVVRDMGITVGQYRELIEKQKRWHWWLSSVALGLIWLGFVLQLVGVYWGAPIPLTA